jgi:hypothetical protein
MWALIALLPLSVACILWFLEWSSDRALSKPQISKGPYSVLAEGWMAKPLRPRK